MYFADRGRVRSWRNLYCLLESPSTYRRRTWQLWLVIGQSDRDFTPVTWLAGKIFSDMPYSVSTSVIFVNENENENENAKTAKLVTQRKC